MSLSTGRTLAVIPARGGSKRIPRKNIRPFNGIPLLIRTLTTVLDSEVFDSVVVSTDDPEIADIARRFGALVPFVRPTYLSDDWTGTAPVIAHALTEATPEFGPFGAVCGIYPGAVLMEAEDYAASSELVAEAVVHDAVVATVVRYGHPIQRALRSGAGGILEPREGQGVLAARTQDLEPMWHDAGQFYWASPSRWSAARPLLSAVVPFEVPEWRVQDIDTEDDWSRAQMIHSIVRSRSAE